MAASTVTDPVHLLWTGGWDSTFRLLQLLLLSDRVVQPHYVIDSGRRSTDIELRTMEDLRRALAKEHPAAAGRLRPTRFQDLAEIPPVPGISQAFLRIRAHTRIGGQYDWLARYCAHEAVSAMELGIHCDDRAHHVLARIVRDGRVREDAHGSDEWQVFRCFRFPLFDTPKTVMAEQAAARGWSRYMDMTWFCHSPRANGTPCGICAPCRFTAEEGLGHRLPLAARLRARVRRLGRGR